MKRILILLWIIAGLAFLSHVSYAQDFSKLEQFMDSLEVHDRFMGALLVGKEGKIAFEHSLGYAESESGQKANNQTRYRIGSVTKMFTATLALMMVEDQKLRLDQPIAEFFPELPHAEKITISHLLQHRSGIHNFTDDAAYFT